MMYADAPCAGARIETTTHDSWCMPYHAMPPVRGRELKQAHRRIKMPDATMPPVRGRELKPEADVCYAIAELDAPCAGARIETIKCQLTPQTTQ